VVQFERLEAPRFPADAQVLGRVVALAFGQRRKMLRASLRPLGDAEALLAEAGIAPTERAEQVPLEGFCRLARALEARRPEASLGRGGVRGLAFGRGALRRGRPRLGAARGASSGEGASAAG
jgi:hypothetical protein